MKSHRVILSRLELENKRENHSHSHPSKNGEDFPDKRRTMRLPRTGKPGLEAIGSILTRLSFVEESPEQEQLNLFTSEPKPKPQEIQLKGLCCCGSRFAKTGAGRRPHELSLHCSQCRRFIAWIPSSELNRLVKRG
jgi:hypothetical protein